MSDGQAARTRKAGGEMSRLRSLLAGPSALALALVLLTGQVTVASEARLIYRVPHARGAVALTFDDGWGEASCERITRTLRANDVSATFFINGVHLNAQPAFWRRILRGFPVGNHTTSHFDLVTQPDSVVRQQIARNEAIHERVLGRPMVKVLRPPYGSQDARVRRIAGTLGYRYTILWSRSAADTSSAATVSSIIRNTTGAPPGAIILMHCAQDVTAAALPAVIRHYKARGIRMVGLDTLLGLPDGSGQGTERPVPPRPPTRPPSEGPFLPDSKG
jgi:peptidoglycan/xylan/chitin deacetylase (PgdA/CDA1 family)